jgi:hypothetical protein
MEVSMEGGIVPGQAMALGQPLEVPDELLGELGSCLLVGGIAEVNPTTQRPGFAGRATTVSILPGARLTFIEWSCRLGCLGQEVVDFGRRKEQGMSILAEPAATSTDQANGRETGHRGIELRIQLAEIGVKPRPFWLLIGDGGSVVSDHFSTVAREIWISLSVCT